MGKGGWGKKMGKGRGHRGLILVGPWGGEAHPAPVMPHIIRAPCRTGDDEASETYCICILAVLMLMSARE